MDQERAADILEWMSPDEAADVLGDLPEEKAEELLGLMEHEEQADVAELLPYEDDTAGGLMTTEFVTLPRALTVGEALARLARDGGNAKHDLLPLRRRGGELVEAVRRDCIAKFDPGGSVDAARRGDAH